MHLVLSSLYLLPKESNLFKDNQNPRSGEKEICNNINVACGFLGVLFHNINEAACDLFCSTVW